MRGVHLEPVLHPLIMDSMMVKVSRGAKTPAVESASRYQMSLFCPPAPTWEMPSVQTYRVGWVLHDVVGHERNGGRAPRRPAALELHVPKPVLPQHAPPPAPEAGIAAGLLQQKARVVALPHLRRHVCRPGLLVIRHLRPGHVAPEIERRRAQILEEPAD